MKAKKPTQTGKKIDYSTQAGRGTLKFQDRNINFEKILSNQRKKQQDEKFAISDSLAEYMEKTITEQGYGSRSKLEDAGIRDDIINFVVNYQSQDLDAIKGMDFNDAQQLQADTDKTIQELEGIVTKPEIDFIKATVGKTNARLGELLNVSTRMSLSFRDLKKEFTPLKLAERFGLTRIPFLGRPLARAVEAEKTAERRAVGIKQRLTTKGLKQSLAYGFDDYDDYGTSMIEDYGADDQIKERASKRAMGVRPELATMMGGKEFGKEETIEEERESDEQFKTQRGLLEDLLEEQKKTNELLSGKSAGGILSKAGDFVGGNAGAFGAGGALLFRKRISGILGNLLPKSLGGDFFKKYAGTGTQTAVDTAKGGANLGKINDIAKSQNAAKTQLTKGAGETATKKALGKGVLKSIGKKLPFGIGLAIAIPFALSKMARGDFLGAGLELAEGGAAIIPGIGTGASAAIGAANITRDVALANNENKVMKTAEITENAINKSTEQSATKAQNVNAVNNNVSTNNVNNNSYINQNRSIGQRNPDSISLINSLS